MWNGWFCIVYYDFDLDKLLNEFLFENEGVEW